MLNATRSAAVFLALCALLLRAQTPAQEVLIRTHLYTPPSTTLHAESNLVEAGLTVRDSNGRSVAGLRASDFEVLDNGIPRRITAFSALRSDGKPTTPIVAPASGKPSETVPPADIPPRQPRYVTFFFDDFHIGASMLFVRKAAHAFIDSGIKPSDWLSIVTASGQGALDFTNDAKLFAARIDRLAAHTRPVVTDACGVSPTDSYIYIHNLDGNVREAAIAAATRCAGCVENSPSCREAAIAVADQAASSVWEQIHAQSIDTLDALRFAAKRLSQMNGTRILILTSSGFLLRPGVPPELQSLIDAAVRSNIAIHAIGGSGLDSTIGFSPKDGLRRDLYLMPLENIAKETGGHYFRDSNDLAGAMELAANPEVSYLLAFNSGAPDGKFHTLKVRFKAKRADSIQFRPGYFSPDPKKALSARAPLDDAVFSKQTLSDVRMTVVLAGGEPKDGLIPVSIRITIDVNPLRFTTFNGRNMQQIAFLLALLDSNGGFVTGKESIMDLALTDEKLASLRRDGLKTVATLNAPPGSYQARIVVREGMKGGLAASTIAVELRTK